MNGSLLAVSVALLAMSGLSGLAGEVERIGVPIRAVVFGNSHGALARSPGGADDMFYIGYYSTTGCHLVGYHAGTGEHVKIPVPSQGVYGLAAGADGSLYLGGVGPGDMYRFDPATSELESLGGREHGVQYIWDIAAAPNGRIYGACYPGANLVEYDPAGRQLRDLGPMAEGVKYVRSVCVDAAGKVWAGLGQRAHLIVCDPATGEKRDVLPEEHRDNSCVYDLQSDGERVFASVLYSGVVLVYEAATERLIDTIPPVEGERGWMITRGAPPGSAYLYTAPSAHLYRYDLADRELTRTVASIGQCELAADGRLLHGIDDQDYFLYDLRDRREIARQHLVEAGDGMAIYTLTRARDGSIYGSTYINQHLFRFEPNTGELTDLGKVIRGGGQVDSIHAGRDGKVYLGAYTHATLAIYDPARPWRPGTEADSNPRELGPVGKGQYRTQSIVLGPDGMIYVGSIPSYNSGPTGAFSRCDPATGEMTVWTDLVPGGAVSRIAADDRWLYCLGGGVFFVFDPQSASKVHEQKLAAQSLLVAPDGRVVISAGKELLVFDPETKAVAARLPSPVDGLDFLALSDEERMYGINGGVIVEIDVEHGEVRQLASEGGKFLAVDQSGRLYFARGSALFRFTP